VSYLKTFTTKRKWKRTSKIVGIILKSSLMALQLKTHSDAREEYISSTQWYELQQAGLGERYANAIGDRIKQILLNPEQFSIVKGNYRHVKIEEFPYTIVYEFFPRRKIIHIAAIFHTGRDPRKKFRREEKAER
jgi:plasmid stabilization system protein ParE